MSVVEEESDDDPVRAAAAEDKAFVKGLIADLRANFEKWEDLLAAQESITFEADLGDVVAVVNQDGRLIHFALARDVMSSYTYIELQARLNAVFEALRNEVREDFERTYGNGVIQ